MVYRARRLERSCGKRHGEVEVRGKSKCAEEWRKVEGQANRVPGSQVGFESLKLERVQLSRSIALCLSRSSGLCLASEPQEKLDLEVEDGSSRRDRKKQVVVVVVLGAVSFCTILRVFSPSPPSILSIIASIYSTVRIL